MKDLTLAALLNRHLNLARALFPSQSTEALNLEDILGRVVHLLRDMHHCPSIEPSILLLENRLRVLQVQPTVLALALQTSLVDALLLAIKTLRQPVDC